MDDRLEQPPRQPGDGPINIAVPREGYVTITVTTDGQEEAITMGEHNAWRVFGSLALLLGIPLSAKVGEAIKF